MRLRPPPTDTPPLRWVSLAALPPALGSAVNRRALHPLRGPLDAWWNPPDLSFSSLLVVAMAIAASLPVLMSWWDTAAWFAASLLSAVVAGWAAWWLDRPRVGVAGAHGLGAFLSTTTLILVDHDAVAVLGAEHLECRDGRWWHGATALGVVSHPTAWDDDLREAARRAQADVAAREADPWRGLSSAPGSASLRAARRRHAAHVVTAVLSTLVLATTVAPRVRRAAAGAFAEAPVGELVSVDSTPLPQTPAPPRQDQAEAVPYFVRAYRDETKATREAAAAGDDNAIRAMLQSPERYDLTTPQVAALHDRLNARCAERFGILPADEGLRAVVLTALELRCVDTFAQLPLITVVSRCTPGTSPRCDELRSVEGRLRDELARFLGRQLAAFLDFGDVRFRYPIETDALYLRLEHRETVTLTRQPRGDDFVLPATIFQRVDLVNRAGRGVGRLVAPHTTLTSIPLRALGPTLCRAVGLRGMEHAPHLWGPVD